TIAGASICGLACGGWLTRGHHILPGLGLVLTTVTAMLLLFGIWKNFIDPPGSNWDFWKVYWQTTFVLMCYAIACSHLSMLFMANLAGGYRWTYIIAYQVVLGLATVLAAAIVVPHLADKEGFWRLVGVLAILVAAVTLVTPVFHRFSRDTVAQSQA